MMGSVENAAEIVEVDSDEDTDFSDDGNCFDSGQEDDVEVLEPLGVVKQEERHLPLLMVVLFVLFCLIRSMEELVYIENSLSLCSAAFLPIIFNQEYLK